MGLYLYAFPALPVFRVGSPSPPTPPSKMPFPRTLGIHGAVGESQLTQAQGPSNRGLSVSFQIVSEQLPGQPGGYGGVRTGLAFGGWILMRWWWVVDRIRNSLSIREAWGAQRCPGISARLGEHFSPNRAEIEGWGGPGRGTAPEERRVHESY